ncbi:murein hydrolase activator EnvC family protein [Serpens gallinarum]|jgi:septal ring factor EnvC (AmiA/AmiB activator)|uniref:Peptidoglycan DD-metalloendopeptidase family protein n=1 Tax=Serpens gallinarum TaxID=2763075 RepID=A0ABR8TJ66_9PSED|nr:peptidoglycan DD-metalloendopeptidase family protein [Serpens gallinarum]MBD7975818.1 peptidoglycan DD-metalloendopeptidase family protein [Serpens gallinarum]
MFRALALILLSCLLAPAFADQKAQTQQQLEAARKDVAELKKMLEKLQQEKSGVQQQLRSTEQEMGELEKQVRELQQQQNQSEAQLKQLDQQKKKLQQSRAEQQRVIGTQARAAYQNGRGEYLKLLLNQQNPAAFSRVQTYYSYLNQARLEQLQGFNDTLVQLHQVESDLDAQQQQLAKQKQAVAERQARLGEVRKERQQALVQLNQDANSRNQKLKARQQDQAELQNVLKTIEATLARQAREAEQARQQALAEERRQRERQRPSGAPVSGEALVSSSGFTFGGPFADARGKLPWPVDGRLLARYGAQRGEDARSTWDGVLIGSRAGQPVRAVHGGRVVFADWLRGAGMLVILDHGGGYLSLYGHNQSLLKTAGDIVKAGDTIATVGTSGGQEIPALYFAIRQQGRPSDPAQWCRAQG